MLGYTVIGFPVVKYGPPQALVDQYTVVEAPLAVKLVPLPLHIVPEDAETEVGSDGLVGKPGEEEPNVISSKQHWLATPSNFMDFAVPEKVTPMVANEYHGEGVGLKVPVAIWLPPPSTSS